MLLLQRTAGLGPTEQLTTVCNSSARQSGDNFPASVGTTHT